VGEKMADEDELTFEDEGSKEHTHKVGSE